MVPISDLIYDSEHGRDCECEKQIRGAFPNATIEPVWDDIHGKRIQVDVDADLEDWFEFLIRTGMYHVSLSFQVAKVDRTKGEMIMAIATRLKTEKEADSGRAT